MDQWEQEKGRSTQFSLFDLRNEVSLICLSFYSLKVLTIDTLCPIVEISLIALAFPSIALGTHSSTVI